MSPSPDIALRAASGQRPEAIAIACSTGGPEALLATLSRLGGPLPQPILVTQHMPAGFTPLLARRITQTVDLPCREAEHGEPLMGGCIYLAPGDWHLEARRDAGGRPLVHLSDGPPVNFCRPSADPLFRSLAEVFGPRLLAVVLTGMGADGQDGAGAVVEAGGTVIAQDQDSSVIWGMPRAVAQAGLCAAVLPLAEIAGHITALSAAPASRGQAP